MVTHAVMRILVAGLVLIAIGIGLTEYDRRHAQAPLPEAAKSRKKKTPAAAAPAPGMAAMLKTVPPEPDAPGDLAAFSRALGALAADAKADGFTTVLSGAYTVRELKGSSGFAVAVVGAGATSGLVKVTPGAGVAAIAARSSTVTALAIDGQTVWWAEGQRVFSAGADGVVKAASQFVNASVAGLAAHEGVVIAALVPKDGDPFATDPSGALVKLESNGSATMVAPEQVRPHDLLLHKSDVFFVAGYPSALVRAALDGSFSAQIAERADGPLAFDGEGIVYRIPQGSPELKRVAPAGGGEVSLAQGDVDWLAASGGVARYTTVGIGSRLYEVSAGQEPKEALALKGIARGLAVVGEHVVLAATTDEGATVIRVK